MAKCLKKYLKKCFLGLKNYLKNTFQREIFQSTESTLILGLITILMMTMLIIISVGECPFYAKHVAHKVYGYYNLLEDTGEYCLSFANFAFLKKFVSDFLAIIEPWTPFMVIPGAYFSLSFQLADLDKEAWVQKVLSFLSFVGMVLLSIFSDGNFGKETMFPIHAIHCPASLIAYVSLWLTQVFNLKSYSKAYKNASLRTFRDLAELMLTTASVVGGLVSMLAMIVLAPWRYYFPQDFEKNTSMTQYEWLLVASLMIPYSKALIKPKGKFRLFTWKNLLNLLFIIAYIVGAVAVELHLFM